MNNYLKFGLLIVAILGALTWLAVGGISDTKTYYKTIKELNQMGDQGKEKRLRVGGDIAPNSITRDGQKVEFTLLQVEGPEKLNLQVVYSGIDPLPDTFKDGAQALADGKLGSRRRFSRHQNSGQVRFEVRSQADQRKARHSRRTLMRSIMHTWKI